MELAYLQPIMLATLYTVGAGLAFALAIIGLWLTALAIVIKIGRVIWQIGIQTVASYRALKKLGRRGVEGVNSAASSAAATSSMILSELKSLAVKVDVRVGVGRVRGSR